MVYDDPAMTNKEAAALVTTALQAGKVLTIECPNGDTLTVGRKGDATGRVLFHALRWGRSRWASPGGREVAWDPSPMLIGHEVVQQCGRGAAGRAARKALA